MQFYPVRHIVLNTYGLAACCLTDVNVALCYVCFIHSLVAVAAEVAYFYETHASVVSTCAFSPLVSRSHFWFPADGVGCVVWRLQGLFCTETTWLMNEVHTVTCLALHYSCWFKTGTRLCHKSSSRWTALCFIPQCLWVCACKTQCVSSAELVVHSGLCKYYSQHKCSATQPHKGMHTLVKVWVWRG